MGRISFSLVILLMCSVFLGISLIWMNITIRKTEYQLQFEIRNSTRLKLDLDSLEKKIKNAARDTPITKILIVTSSKASVVKLIKGDSFRKIDYARDSSKSTLDQKIGKLEEVQLSFKSRLKVPVEIDQYLNILYVSISLFERNYDSVKFSVKKQDLTGDNNLPEDYEFKLNSYVRNNDSTFQIILGEVRPPNLILEDPVNYNKHLTIKISGKISSEMIDCVFLWRDIVDRLKTAKIKLVTQKGK